MFAVALDCVSFEVCSHAPETATRCYCVIESPRLNPVPGMYVLGSRPSTSAAPDRILSLYFGVRRRARPVLGLAYRHDHLPLSVDSTALHVRTNIHTA
jgi:hypothetical protein